MRGLMKKQMERKRYVSAIKRKKYRTLLSLKFKDYFREGTRNYGVRNFGWSVGCNSDHCDNGFQTKTRRIMDSYFRWNLKLIENDLHRGRSRKGAVRASNNFIRVKIHESQGQSTVEYALVLSAVLCIVVAIGSLMNLLHDGTFIRHAINAASHNIESVFGGAVDVFCF